MLSTAGGHENDVISYDFIYYAQNRGGVIVHDIQYFLPKNYVFGNNENGLL